MAYPGKEPSPAEVAELLRTSAMLQDNIGATLHKQAEAYRAMATELEGLTGLRLKTRAHELWKELTNAS